jgi:hypothetical protein
MVAVLKELEREAQPHRVVSEEFVPEGFEVEPEAGSIFRVKLRRALHRGAPLGVTISTREGARSTRIQQFDISPRLDLLARADARERLLKAYVLLQDKLQFKNGLSQLECLERESLCVACRFRTINSEVTPAVAER